MKPTIPTFLRAPRIALAVLLGVMACPVIADAKPKDKDKGRKYAKSSRSYSNHHHTRNYYHSAPRSGFSITLGTGYAGYGYYYGPPGVPYYYSRPDVRYYRYRSQVPQAYFNDGYYNNGGYYGSSTAVAVQRALYRQGYYYGTIDGAIGPASRRAIASYQSAHGLDVTGTITRELLVTMGIA